MMFDSYEKFENYESSIHYNFTANYTLSTADYGDKSDFGNTTWEDDEICAPAPPGSLLSTTTFQFFVLFMYCTVFIVALVGNGLVCFVVQTSPRMKTVTNYFIMNLAIGDILMTIFCVPFSFVSMLVLRYWPFGIVMCKIVNYSQAVSVLVSAYTLLAISIDRYMAIMRPLKPRLGKTAAKMVVAAVWGGALSTAGPIFIVSRIERPTEWHQYCKADICLEQWERPEQSHQYSCALMVLQFGLPLAALVCTYARIAHVVWGGRPPGEAQTVRDMRIQHSKRKMIKMMVTVVVVFTVCWLPLNIFIILWTIHEQDEDWATWPGMPYVWFVSHWLAMSHCCYNPFIYCYMNIRYRRGFKQVLGNVLPIRDHPSQSHRRSSLCDGVPMSELVGANGIVRRGTTSSCSGSRLHRAATCSSTTSTRRGYAACASSARLVTATAPAPPPLPVAPVRAVSLRSRFH
ncbi:RYamide receptor-like [Maniola hyperantus]|uniref:RYamide receptor-like n=1 Tax=Aphantopus hyperantus TaxID=2795564 RepID=UPI00156A2A6A|nr:RYamide receptor-like [Maniola hyperantus]